MLYHLLVISVLNKSDKSGVREHMKKLMCVCFALFAGLVAFPAFARDITLVDIAGRTVAVPKGAERVILGEGRMVYAIAPLFGKYGNMFNHIVGTKNDLRLYDPDAYRKYLARFPQLADIPEFGSPYKGDFDIERAIAINADVILMNLGNYFKVMESGIVEKLEKAGIKTVFVDFRQAPTRNTVPSLLILGKVFGKQRESLEVIDFYISQMQKVYARVANKKDSERPLVFIESAAASGWGDCCSTFGDNNMGRFVSVAGGRNLGTKLFGGFRGKVSPEYIFKEDPDIIIGTGANWSEAKPATRAVLLGYEADPYDVQRRISDLANRKGWSDLSAVRSGNFYSIYHQFYNSPYNFVAVQYFAKAFYPDDFEDLDPEDTFVEFHDKFLPIDYSGQFWATY